MAINMQAMMFIPVGVLICKLDCTRSAEWVSPNKIICISGPAIGKGDVIVTTRSGGRGTCTVKFTGIREIIGMYNFDMQYDIQYPGVRNVY